MTDPLLAAWRDKAACRTAPIYRDADPFHPNQPITAKSWHDARQICGPCPVRAQCLQDVIEHKDVHGMRGGFTPGQLLSRVRAQKPTPKPVALVAHPNKEHAGASLLRARIAELALSGMPARKIALDVDRALVTVQHHLRDLRTAGRIPIDAGCAEPMVIACGTLSGYRKHKRAKNKACAPCREAYNVTQRAARAVS